MEFISWVDGLALLASSGLLLLLAVTSWREGEWRAVWLSLFFIAVSVILWVALWMLRHEAVARSINHVLLVLLVAFIALSLFEFFPDRPPPLEREHIERYDERDHMFSRNQLKFHPGLAGTYYAENPQYRPVDEKIHMRPELGEPGQVYHDPVYSPAFAAAFSFLDRTRGAASGDVSPVRSTAAAAEIAAVILQLARFYGAVDAGIAPLRPYHFYSRRGRRAEGWGEAIEAGRGSAIVVVVAMDWKMIARAPSLSAVLESSRQYVEAAKIAMIIAEYLRRLGFQARAHTDGNYEVLCVPLAIDAGLGELGRLGVLIHPVHGPCVRLAVVTTELELPPSYGRDFHAASFCRICRKCAENCPTRAIASADEPSARGFRHWSIEQEKCYGFWKQVGSDCAVCIRSCPYTKPDTLLHRLVRFYISRNSLNQRLALFFDDLFYGRRKKISPVNPGEILPT